MVSKWLWFFGFGGSADRTFHQLCIRNRLAAAQAEREPAGEPAAGGQVVGEGALDALPDGLHVFLVQLVVTGKEGRSTKITRKNIAKTCQAR